MFSQSDAWFRNAPFLYIKIEILIDRVAAFDYFVSFGEIKKQRELRFDS